MKMKKQTLSRGLSFRRKTDSSTAKVLPVTDAAVGTPASRNGHKEQNFSADTKEKAKGDQTKTTSKMKELIKWAAAAKSQKGGKYFGRKVKISFNRIRILTILTCIHRQLFSETLFVLM